MKSIILNGAALRNDQSYVDAGTTVAVGDKPDEIARDRAKELVASGRADAAAAVDDPAKHAPKA